METLTEDLDTELCRLYIASELIGNYEPEPGFDDLDDLQYTGDTIFTAILNS